MHLKSPAINRTVCAPAVNNGCAAVLGRNLDQDTFVSLAVRGGVSTSYYDRAGQAKKLHRNVRDRSALIYSTPAYSAPNTIGSDMPRDRATCKYVSK